jgi:Integrase core domain
VLESLVAAKGAAPEFIRMDNGPELTANALRDWCRFSESGSVYIEPGSPWESPFIESFNGKLRDELLNLEAFETLLEAQVLAEDFRIEYNTCRPQSSLGGPTPLRVCRAVAPKTNLDSHSWWISNRGPVRTGRAPRFMGIRGLKHAEVSALTLGPCAASRPRASLATTTEV